MRCIFCGNIDSKVVDSRYLKDTSIRRRRECLVCGKRFTTYETVETNPMVVTNVDNMREPFKTEKLMESIKAATYCVDMEYPIEDIVIKIESELLKKQQQEISTRDIVSVALGVLMEVSSMACLVYYTQHTDCETFEDVRRFINR
jgi:transcriptional repressor NrdR